MVAVTGKVILSSAIADLSVTAARKPLGSCDEGKRHEGPVEAAHQRKPSIVTEGWD